MAISRDFGPVGRFTTSFQQTFRAASAPRPSHQGEVGPNDPCEVEFTCAQGPGSPRNQGPGSLKNHGMGAPTNRGQGSLKKLVGQSLQFAGSVGAGMMGWPAAPLIEPQTHRHGEGGGSELGDKWDPEAARHFLDSTTPEMRPQWLKILDTVGLLNTSLLSKKGLEALQIGYQRASSQEKAEAYLDSIREQMQKLIYYGDSGVTQVLETFNDFHQDPERLQGFLNLRKGKLSPDRARRLMDGAVRVSPGRTAELFHRLGTPELKWSDESLAPLQALVERLDGSPELDPIFRTLAGWYKMNEGWSQHLADGCLKAAAHPGHLEVFGSLLDETGARAFGLYERLSELERPLVETVEMALHGGCLSGSTSVVKRQPEALEDVVNLMWSWRDRGLTHDQTAQLTRYALFSDHRWGTPLHDMQILDALPLESADHRRALTEWMSASRQASGASDYLNLLISVAPERVGENHDDMKALGLLGTLYDLEPVCRALDALKAEHKRDLVLESLKWVLKSCQHRVETDEVFEALSEDLPTSKSALSAWLSFMRAGVEADRLGPLSREYHELKPAKFEPVLKLFQDKAADKAETFLKLYREADAEQREAAVEWFQKPAVYECPEAVAQFFQMVKQAGADERKFLAVLLRGGTPAGEAVAIRDMLSGRKDALRFAKQLRHAGVTQTRYHRPHNPGIARAYTTGMLEYRNQGRWVWTSRRKVAADYERLKGQRSELSGPDFEKFYQLQGSDRADYEVYLGDPDLSDASTAWELSHELLAEVPVKRKVEIVRDLKLAGGEAVQGRAAQKAVLLAVETLKRSMELSDVITALKNLLNKAKELPPETVTSVVDRLRWSSDPEEMLEKLLVTNDPERLLSVALSTPQDLNIKVEEDAIIVGGHSLEIG